MLAGNFKFNFLRYFFVKKISLSRCVGNVMGGWISGSVGHRCMYVTPIRLDVLLNSNQISCCKGKWYVRDLIPIQLRTAIFILL